MSRGIKLLSLAILILLPALAWAGYGAISGTVIDQTTSMPILGAHVMAKSGSGPYPHITLGEAVSDSNGNYIIENLPTAADYVVLACRMGYECEFYDNSPTVSGATIVHVTDGATTSGIDFSLIPALGGGTGAISGYVSDEATSLPLPGTPVVALSADSTHHAAGGAMTDLNGDYTIHNLPDGDYYVGACTPFYVCEIYDNVTDISSATLVHVAENTTTTGIDFALAHILGGQGTISGTVTDSFTGQPIAGAKILAHNNVGMHFKACTDSTGHYSLTVPAGSYALVAWAHDYHPALYPGIVTVNDGDNLTIDFQFIPFAFGAIAGNVTDATNSAPIFHALQIAKKIHGRGFGWGISDSTGNYTIDHLPSGFYHVASIAHGYHLSLYPDSVEVLPFSTTSGIDFQLTPRDTSHSLLAGSLTTSISGTVYDDSTGLPLNFAIVVLVAQKSANSFVLHFAFADAGGNYAFNDLEILNYYALAWSPGYMAELYNDAHSLDSADLVAPPQAGVDFYLTKCSDGPWAINGRVATAVNPMLGVAGVVVNAYNTSGQLAASAYSMPGSGAYTLEGLEPGSYAVQVSSYSGSAPSQQVQISGNDANEVNFLLSSSGPGLRGDVNSDGNISLADVITIVNGIFKPALFPPVSIDKGDVNCSGTVTLGDAIYLVNYILKSGPVPCSN
jgi:hypothetical protein